MNRVYKNGFNLRRQRCLSRTLFACSLRTRPPEVVGPVPFLGFRHRGSHYFNFAM